MADQGNGLHHRNVTASSNEQNPDKNDKPEDRLEEEKEDKQMGNVSQVRLFSD